MFFPCPHLRASPKLKIAFDSTLDFPDATSFSVLPPPPLGKALENISRDFDPGKGEEEEEDEGILVCRSCLEEREGGSSPATGRLED